MTFRSLLLTIPQAVIATAAAQPANVDPIKFARYPHVHGQDGKYQYTNGTSSSR